MVAFKDNEMQMRYDRIADRDLQKIFSEFSFKCKREKIAILPRFSGEQGLALLKERAKEMGYVLGSKIHLQRGINIVDISTIEFVVKPISIRDGDVFIDGKKRRNWKKLENPMLSGFGVEMCLLGWSKFSGITCTDISKKLNEGIGIEEILGRKRPQGGKTIMYNGSSMPIREALKAACIPLFEYVSKMRRVDETSSQSVFDELAKKHKTEAQCGVLRHFDRIWLSVSEDDFCVIQSIGKHRAITEQQALHLFITENKTKGE